MWLLTGFVVAIVGAVLLTLRFVNNKEFMEIEDVMERNGVEFERVERGRREGRIRLHPKDAVQRALDRYVAYDFPRSEAYLGRFTAPHLGDGFEDYLVYAILVKGFQPGPVIRGNGEPQEFVVLLSARDWQEGDGFWSIGLPAEPPYLVPEPTP
jgi:hypothetical protein